MKYKVGTKVIVKDCYGFANFENGDVVVIKQIGNEDEPDCYGAISPYDGLMWYLGEEEVSAATIGDCIRSMSDKELAKFLADFHNRDYFGRLFCNLDDLDTGYCLASNRKCLGCILEWLKKTPLDNE